MTQAQTSSKRAAQAVRPGSDRAGVEAQPKGKPEVAPRTDPWAGVHPKNYDPAKPLIYVNGRLVPRGEASVNVYDHGLLYGDGVFEGIRVYRGRIFKLEQHMDRLWASAEAIGIDIPISRAEMIDVQRRCIEANEISDGYIRLIVTRGEGTLGLHPGMCPVPGVICIADQIALYPPELYENGMRVVLAQRPRIPVGCLDPRIKSLNYLNNILAKTEAIEAGCLECIMFNLQGELAEGSGDNIFLVKDGQITTPPSTVGLLEGITRRFVKDELCPLAGIDCEERILRKEDLFEADEIFLTGTAAEMIAVTRIGKTDADAHVVGTGLEGTITKQLRAKFTQVVTSDQVPED